MAERYTRLFRMEPALYTPGSPLVITAGALLKDGQTGQVLVQLKLQSLSDLAIRGVQVQVVGFDISKAEVCREEHQYLDLNVRRDDFFGFKEAILLPVRSVRSFSVRVAAVFFADGSRYDGPELVWHSIPAQQELIVRLFDVELIRQYQLDTTEASRFVPMEYEDLWLCACGGINHAGETCHKCRQSYADVVRLLDVEQLKTRKTKRLQEEAEREQTDEGRRLSRAKRMRRILFLLIPLLLLTGVALSAYLVSAHRANLYDEAAIHYLAGDYATAADIWEKLGDYRDAAARAAASKNSDSQVSSYTRAGKLLENGRYDDAHELYLSLGDYEDSAALAQEALYRKGQELIETGAYEEARALFASLTGYRDSAKIASHFRERLLREELSYSEEVGGPLVTEYRYDDKGRLAEKVVLYSAYEKRQDAVSVYTHNEDGSYSVTEGQVERRYDKYGSYLGQGALTSYTYEYSFYPDGSVQYFIASDASSGDYRSSASYDEHGNLVREELEDGSSRTVRNEYKDDRLVKQESYDDSGALLDRTSFDYNEQGRLKRKSFLTPGASTAVSTSYTYGVVYLPEASE